MVAVACGVVSYVVMNLLMTSAPIAMVGCGHSVTDLDARHPVACARHVCAELCDRPPDRPIRRVRVIAAGWRCCSLSAVVSMRRRAIVRALLDQPGAGGRRLELRLHRRDHAGDALPPPGGAQQRSSRFNDFLIFGTMALGSFASGKMLATVGWEWVNIAAFLPVLVVALLLALAACASAASPV